MSQTIILFGGAFDPPHNGHLAMAQAATDEIKPDKLLWIPTAHPAHRDAAVASFEQRCEMIELVIADQPTWELCTIENERDGPSYFIDTLNTLAELYPSAKLYLLIGEDQLASFKQWHEWKEITKKATLLVMTRTGIDASEVIKELQPTRLNTDPINVSSTKIRANHANSSWLPVAINHYISLNHLYHY